MSSQPRFTDRLIDEFHKSGFDNIDQIVNLIKNFSQAEYERRKNNHSEMPFGKYKFKKVADIAKFDMQYLIWVRKQGFIENYRDLALEIDKFLK